MTDGLTVRWHDLTDPTAPPGWDAFVTGQRLWAVWDWPILHTMATDARVASLAATFHDGGSLVGLATARFPGLRTGRRRVPLAGVVDVDCLASASAPGIVLADPDPRLRVEVVQALREALRREYGRRVRAMMFRQLTTDWLPAALRWPAVVREGMPIAVFRNRFNHFDDYLASLSGRRRGTLRQLVRVLDADPDLTSAFTGRGDLLGQLTAREVCRLETDVVDRHHRRWWLRKRTPSLPVIRAHLTHPQALPATYHDHGTLAAYGLVWDHPRHPLAHSWGALAPADSGRKGLYFHFNALLVRWCIETGREAVTFGQGNADEKRRLGYELTRQWAVLVPQRHRSARR